MKIANSFFILKNKLFRINNIILIGILSLIIVVIFACITIINFASVFQTSMLDSSLGRTLIITKPSTQEELEKIESIEYIELIASNRYAHPVELLAEQFTRSTLSGTIQLRPLLIDSDVNIVKGTSLAESGSIVCPVNFYPHLPYIISDNINWESYFNHSYVLSSEELIGKTINLETWDEEEFSFELVGAFTNKILTELNICYITIEDFNSIRSNIEYCDDEQCFEFNSLMIRVDNYNNVTYVEEDLLSLGFLSTRLFTFDEEILNIMTYIPIFIGSLVLIISITIIYNFFKKKSNNNQYQYGVLKSVGYTNKDISIIAVTEGLLIHLISIIFAVILYSLFYYIISANFLHEFNFYYFTVPTPWPYILLFIIISFIYVKFIIKLFTKKRLNSCVNKLFEGK